MGKTTIQIADKPTLDEVNNKLDSVRQDIKGVETNITGSLTGEASAFGTGVLGDVVYSEEFIYPSKDYYGRYILLCKNFTLPEGITMIPPEKCNGLYIYCQGTCTINGTIDMRGKRLTLDSDNGISNFIKVGETTYPLAVGGHTVKGGDSGKSGKITMDSSYHSPSNKAEWYNAGLALIGTSAGNINGGGTSTFGVAGEAFKNLYLRNGASSGSKVLTYSEGTDGHTSDFRPAPGAVIIIANTVIINGSINCVATDGLPCTNGEDASDVTCSVSGGAVLISADGNAGKAGNGAQAPTGGGCVTVITSSFTNNGRMLVNGSSLVCANGSNGQQMSASDSTSGSDDDTGHGRVIATGGEGGIGGTFISQAGEIKIHIIPTV